MGLSTSGEAAHAYLDWLTVVARDEFEALWPHVEKVAQTLVARTDFDRGGGQDPAGVAVTGGERRRRPPSASAPVPAAARAGPGAVSGLNPVVPWSLPCERPPAVALRPGISASPGTTPGLYAFRLGAGTRCAVTCRTEATAGGPRSVLARSSIRGRPFLTAPALIRAPVGRRFDPSRSGRSGRARSAKQHAVVRAAVVGEDVRQDAVTNRILGGQTAGVRRDAGRRQARDRSSRRLVASPWAIN